MVIAELKLDMTIVKVLRQVYKQVDSDSLQKLKAVITVVKLGIYRRQISNAIVARFKKTKWSF